MLAVLLFVATAGMTTLFVVDKNNSDDTISRQKTEIADLKRDVQESEHELATTKQNLSAAKGQAETLQRQTESQSPCIKAVQEFFAAAETENERALERALTTMWDKCEGLDDVDA